MLLQLWLYIFVHTLDINGRSLPLLLTVDLTVPPDLQVPASSRSRSCIVTYSGLTAQFPLPFGR